MCTSITESHMSRDSWSSRGFLKSQRPQRGKNTTLAPKLLRCRERYYKKLLFTFLFRQRLKLRGSLIRFLCYKHTEQKNKYIKILNSGWVARTISKLSATFTWKNVSVLRSKSKEQDDSSAIVVVLLLTKPTLSGLSVGTSHRPDCWTDTMTEVLSFSLSQFPGLTPRLDSLGFLAPADDVSVTPWTNVLSGGDKWETADNGLYLEGWTSLPRRTGRWRYIKKKKIKNLRDVDRSSHTSEELFNPKVIATRRKCELSPAAKVKGGRRNARTERRQKEVICKKA